MRVLAICALLITIGVSAVSASMDRGTTRSHTSYDLVSRLPGEHLLDIAIDRNGRAYFVTVERDTITETPIWSSSFPAWRYLVTYSSDVDSFQLAARDFPNASRIIFDLENNLWIMTGKSLDGWHDAAVESVISLDRDSGLFQTIVVDSSNAVWVGGFHTGLYRVTAGQPVLHLTDSNSDLTGNSVSALHVAGPGSIWVGMWMNIGILHIQGNDWTLYDPYEAQAPLSKIWCLATDSLGDLWIGTGYDHIRSSLVRFDGDEWHVGTPENPDGTKIEGATVRRLVFDGTRMWVLTETGPDNDTHLQHLRISDGSTWAIVPEIPEGSAIWDIEADRTNHVVWVGTIEGADHQTMLHRFAY